MAQQKGTVKYKGTLSGVNYYFRKGKAVAREAGGGFNGDAIRKSPKMERVRENAGEFGMVSKAKKLIRLGLHPFLMDFADATLHGRMMTLFQQIKLLDTTTPRGQRTFENGLATEEGKRMLRHFEFTKQRASMMLPGKGEFHLDAQDYTISDIKPGKLRLPNGASGMQLCLGILQPDFSGQSWQFHQSQEVFLDAESTATTLTLSPETLPDSNGICIAVLQVRFYNETNGTKYLLNDLNTQGLEVVGVY